MQSGASEARRGATRSMHLKQPLRVQHVLDGPHEVECSSAHPKRSRKACRKETAERVAARFRITAPRNRVRAVECR